MNLIKPIAIVVIFLLFVFSLACNHPQKAVDKYVGFTETDKIIDAVISKNGFPVKKGDEKHAPGVVIISLLNRIYVINEHSPNNTYPTSVYFSHLIQDRYFQKSDSVFLFNQNNRQESDSISATFQKQLILPKTTPSGGIDEDINTAYKFTMPLYSKDGKTVFICVVNYCGKCMDIVSYFLKKSGDSWHVVGSRRFKEIDD